MQNPNSFIEIYNAYYPSLHRQASILLSDDSLAEEIVHDSFVRMLQKLDIFHSADHIRAYLSSTVRNSCLNHLRYKYKTKTDTAYYESFIAEESIAHPIEESEDLTSIYREMEYLTSTQRSVLKLIYLEGLSKEETAKILNKSLNSISSIQNFALKSLRDRINKNNIRPGKEKNINKEEPHRLCLRIKGGCIEILIQKSDGGWLLSDGTMELANGLFVFNRSKWTNILNEMEKLINKRDLQERELQEFFTTHPELILGDEYECFFPQATIVRDDQKKWYADFVLVPSDQLSFSKILELKLPTERISNVGKNGHDDYSKKLFRAIHQLKNYYQAFDSDRTKQKFKEMYHTEIFKPDLQLVFGRRNSINNNRQFLEFQRRENLIITDWDTLYDQLRKKYK
jgi:RNA polymerase sigma factor (sigma-70 family)